MLAQVKIEASLCYQYSNTQHASFHQTMHSIVGTVDQSNINVSAALMTQWEESIALEVDINRQVTASIYTQQLHDKDRERDDMILYIFASIRNECRSPLADHREAAKQLVLIVDKYKDIYDVAPDDETVLIDGLITDFSKTNSFKSITVLGLNQYCEALNDLNTEYKTLVDTRQSTRVAEKLPSSKAVRVETDGDYEQICLLIEASYLIAADEAVKSEIFALVERMNQTIIETKANFKQRKAQKGSNGDSTDPDLPTPDPEQPPTDPDLPTEN